MKWKTTAALLGKLVLEGRRKTDVPGLGLDADASSHLHLPTPWPAPHYYPHLPGGEANLERKKARSHSKYLAEPGLQPRYFIGYSSAAPENGALSHRTTTRSLWIPSQCVTLTGYHPGKIKPTP